VPSTTRNDSRSRVHAGCGTAASSGSSGDSSPLVVCLNGATLDRLDLLDCSTTATSILLICRDDRNEIVPYRVGSPAASRTDVRISANGTPRYGRVRRRLLNLCMPRRTCRRSARLVFSSDRGERVGHQNSCWRQDASITCQAVRCVWPNPGSHSSNLPGSATSRDRARCPPSLANARSPTSRPAPHDPQSRAVDQSPRPAGRTPLNLDFGLRLVRPASAFIDP